MGLRDPLPGRLVRQLRQQQGLSQGELAARLGLENGNFVSMIETGRCMVPLDKIRPLCQLLGLPETWLWERALAARNKGGCAGFTDWLFGPQGQLRARYEADLAQAQALLGLA